MPVARPRRLIQQAGSFFVDKPPDPTEDNYLTSDIMRFVTLSRGSSGTYYDSSGYLKTASSGVARFDYNPSTLAKRGLLVESSKTNLFIYSNTFTDAGAWYPNGAVTSGTTTGPDNTSSSASTFTVTSGWVNLRQSITATSDATYAASFHVKYSNNQWLMLQLSDSGVTHRARVWFDIQNGSKGTSATTGSGAVVSYDIIALPNGWYRIYLRATNPVTSLYCYLQIVTGDGVTTGAANSQAFYVYGAQLEASDVSSYIATTTSTVQRSADSLTAVLYTSESVTEYYRSTSTLSQSSKTINPFSGVSSETDIWVEKFTKP